MASPLRLLSPSPLPSAVDLIDVSPEALRDRTKTPARPQLPGPGVDIDSLRCFEAVATTLRFRTAAARVHLSPAAFSDRIRRLEESLGVAILTRTTRAVALTDAGHRLLPITRRILSLIDCLAGTASDESGSEPSYEFLLGAAAEMGQSWLCKILDPLSRKRPERTVHLYAGSSTDLVSRLERGELDAAVTSARFSSPRLTYAALHAEEYVLVGVDRGLRGPEDARQFTLVDLSPDLPLFRYFLDGQPNAEPWRFGRVEYMGGIANQRYRLLRGEGRVGVLPTSIAREDLAKKRLFRLMPNVTLCSDSVRLVWRLDHPRHEDLTTLAHDLREFPLRY